MSSLIAMVAGSELRDKVTLVANQPITPAVGKILLNLIDAIRKYKHGNEFAFPVDWQGLGLHEYLSIVQRPMDLSTLSNNLLSGTYTRLWEFLQDANLIFENCKNFNGKSNIYWQFATESQEFMRQRVCRHYPLLGVNESIYDAVMNNNFTQLSRDQLPRPTPLQLNVLADMMSLLSPERLAEVISVYVKESKQENIVSTESGDQIVVDLENADLYALHFMYEKALELYTQQERDIASGAAQLSRVRSSNYEN